MSPATILYMTNLQSFRFHAERWDDLWRRSLVSHPTARADLITAWLQRFDAQGQFQAIAVCQEGRFVAGLPLVLKRKGHLVSCLDVPGNEWSSAGQLLLAPEANIPEVCDRLIEGLSQLACVAYWFASVPVQASWWQALAAAAERAGWDVDQRVRYQVGILDLADSWSREQQRLSKGLRKQVGRSLRRLESAGPLKLQFHLPGGDSETLHRFAQGLKLEHAGWKGAAGTSLLANPVAAQFACDQARQLAVEHQQAIVSLELSGQPIAFEFGWLAKQVYHSYKVGYDPRFARFGPGHVLLYLLLQRFHGEGTVRAIDFLGPLDAAVRRWHPRLYPMGRLLLAPPRPLGKAVVFATRHLLPCDQPNPSAVP